MLKEKYGSKINKTSIKSSLEENLIIDYNITNEKTVTDNTIHSDYHITNEKTVTNKKTVTKIVTA